MSITSPKLARSTLPVYRRQLFPDPVLGERAPAGTTMFETDTVRMWHLGDDVGIVSFKSKGHTIGEDVLDGVNRAIDEAEKNCAGLVIWQTKEPFSFGANLAAIAPAIAAKQWTAIDAVVAKFQRTALRMRYSLIPTVCAVRGMALGGSCEFIMHADRVVAAAADQVHQFAAPLATPSIIASTSRFAVFLATWLIDLGTAAAFLRSSVCCF